MTELHGNNPQISASGEMDLSAIRQEIDRIDEGLVRDISRRSMLAFAVGEYKKQNKLPIVSQEREEALISRIVAMNPGPLSDHQLVAHFIRLVEDSQSLQATMDGVEIGRYLEDDPTKTKVLSGFRPTQDLTLGNYFGAIRPLLEVQDNPDYALTAFVADMHALTDHRPDEVAPYRKEVIRDCLALGIDPNKTTLYMQSSIEEQVVTIANRISPHVSVGELARTPNLKEKMQQILQAKEFDDTSYSSRANLALLAYPSLMAADIYSQDTPKVAVGQDQEPHLEIAREIARRFNKNFKDQYGKILVSPTILAVEGLRVMALDGAGKMSKTKPNTAILFSDDPDRARQKIKRATTANSGQWEGTPLESHYAIATGLANPDEIEEFSSLKQAHIEGRQVMADFKNLWADVTERTLVDFQERRAAISDGDVDMALQLGATKAFVRSERVLQRIKKSMGF